MIFTLEGVEKFSQVIQVKQSSKDSVMIEKWTAFRGDQSVVTISLSMLFKIVS